MLTPEAAWKTITPHLEPLPARPTPRSQAGGLTLAGSLPATVDMPPADVSAMDGYACAGEVAAEIALPVLGTVGAGTVPDFELAPGTAAKIMTGAVVPVGADRVVQVERTDGGDQQVVVRHTPPQPGEHLRHRGEVVRRGEPLLAAGTQLSPGAISLVAAHGYAEVPAHRPPAVAVLATGDEVVPPESEPAAGQLRDSNTAFLVAAGRTLGLEPRSLGIAPDRREALRALIAEGLSADVLLLAGGVSMGEFDMVEEVLAELGCEPLFDRVAIQPGKPLVAARHAAGWVLGLPGNPASVMVTFWLFGRPLIRRLMGIPDGFWHGALAAELTAALPAGRDRDRFLPADVALRNGTLLATPHPPRGSHDLPVYSRGTALVRIRPRAEPAVAGSPCEILPLAHGVII
ncbi:MAG: molybdopterin molybdotransferase MoeA [bacterium]|nr:molybdopterin molybdotransferase MoeA [bacterium]